MLRRALGNVVVIATLLVAPSALAAETYVFDQPHTNVQIHWEHFGFSTTSAEFEDVSGRLEYNPEQLTDSTINVTIDMDSVDSGFAPFNGHLRNKEEWFNTARYPQATFKSTSIKGLGQQQYMVTGDLTIKGVTREVTLDTNINRIGKHPVSKARTIGLDASTTVSRSAFDMGQYAPDVSDEVMITISTEMQRKSDLSN